MRISTEALPKHLEPAVNWISGLIGQRIAAFERQERSNPLLGSHFGKTTRLSSPWQRQENTARAQDGCLGATNITASTAFLSLLSEFTPRCHPALRFPLKADCATLLMASMAPDRWPLPDGAKGMDFLELMKAPADDKRAAATRKRETAVQTLGNLTILSSALNSAQSNLSWKKKLPELMKHSLLPINQALNELSAWDEQSILERGEDHYKRAVEIWAR